MGSSYTEEELRSEISRNENQISQLNTQNESLKQKISRIDKAKSKVSSAKTNYDQLRKETQSALKKKEEWEGSRFDKCQNQFDLLDKSDSTAYKNIDAVLDALERAQGEYENKMNNNNSLIGKLKSGINWCYHEIKTWFN